MATRQRAVRGRVLCREGSSEEQVTGRLQLQGTLRWVAPFEVSPWNWALRLQPGLNRGQELSRRGPDGSSQKHLGQLFSK